MPNLRQFQKDDSFLMLDFADQGILQKLINPESPDTVTPPTVIQAKKELIESLIDESSGLLIDMNYGLNAYQDRSVPFILPVAKDESNQDSGERITKLSYGVSELQTWGASGVKLRLYFNPYLDSAAEQIDTAEMVIKEAKQLDFPIFLELIAYESDHEISVEEREKLLIEGLKKFKAMDIMPDVFTLEYPGSAVLCRTITAVLDSAQIPWILVDRGESFAEFKDHLKEAISRGAKGFMVGKALWQEIFKLQEEEKQTFLDETLPERLRELCSFSTISSIK